MYDGGRRGDCSYEFGRNSRPEVFIFNRNTSLLVLVVASAKNQLPNGGSQAVSHRLFHGISLLSLSDVDFIRFNAKPKQTMKIFFFDE